MEFYLSHPLGTGGRLRYWKGEIGWTDMKEILQRMEETYEQESGCKVRDVSEVGLRLRALAGELYRLETSMEWLERQAFPQTATGAQLDLHGALRGVPRKPAEKAKGVVSFSRYLPISFDLVVPKGTVCATSGEPVVEYETTEEVILKARNPDH